MKLKTTFLAACMLASAATVFGNWIEGRDLAQDLPLLTSESESFVAGFECYPNVAQYKQGDWSGCIGMAPGVSLEEALIIANRNPEITFFFYTKGGCLVLETDTDYRMFRYGDAVFFTGEPHFGSAPGLADGYVRTEG